MATMMIHYESPASDPFKVPRPHRVQIEGTKVGKPEGGEIGTVTTLLGFCPAVTPDPDNWQVADALEVAKYPEHYVGWFAQFIDDEGKMFGYDNPISRVEVTA
ncbi:hypothetical protein G7068_15975 [Leucobacter viscericola]|uniref:Uncharacterized protein n=1 Tax=Leucobacter viscericola TaxID=2714935 RepID=A0A6G7XBE5_9MICO|nr:hypothetical protein [Leucobacter viscericola]QIK61769.1 hypothetical protein G7068_00010 [Leucobacter viscericola]QIK64544.1 hypothetical protein G7068_15975 [Leucobacter viscericola]